MDGIDFKSNGLELVKKYRYILLIFLIGMFLMLLPEKESVPEIKTEQSIQEEESLQTSLAKILSKIQGAGKTEVLLTEAAGAQTYYQADESVSSTDNSKDQRRDTVLVSNGSREEVGLIRRIDPPKYQGAIVLCQGAEDARVKLAIVEAVSNATGLSTDKITVLKMK